MKYRLLILILSWISFLIFGAIIFNGLPIVQAATPIIVTTTNDELNDDSSCSLREAIRAANSDSVVSGCAAGSGHDTIILPTGIYTLTIPGVREDAALTGDLDITSHLTIDGEGAGTTIIDGNRNSQTMWDRVFDITASGHATLKNVTIQNGDVGGGANGGGIRNYGVLTLTNSILSDNIAHAGGGLLNVGTTTFFSSTIRHNSVSDSGGGIRNDATLTIVNSVVYSNTASGGGGISNNSSVTILNSTLSNNQANSNGGGVYNGFGFYNEPPAMLNLNNVTITNNIADADNNGSGSGGGMLSEPTSVVNIKNSIISMNFGSVGSSDCSGPLNSQGYNLVQDINNCNISGDTTGNIFGVDAKLGPLQDNGGTTLTHALLFGSPAIDGGNPIPPKSSEHACEILDQRGVTRPQNSRCDIGAVEYNGQAERQYLPLILK